MEEGRLLGRWGHGPVSLDAESSFSFQSTRWWDNVDEARWILQSDNGQLYISQYTVAGAQDNWGTTNEFLDPLSSTWAVYNPAVNNLDFRHDSATWIDPVANNLFGDIQAVGVYVANDTPSGDLTKFSLDEIQFNAVVTQNLSAVSTSLGANQLLENFSAADVGALRSPEEKTSDVLVDNAIAEYTSAFDAREVFEESTSFPAVQTEREDASVSNADEGRPSGLELLDAGFAAWVGI